MPRIKLAFWHGDHVPGDVVDVTADELAALSRDGRVAEVLGYDNGGVLEAKAAESVNESDEPEAVEPAPSTGRKRR